MSPTDQDRNSPKALVLHGGWPGHQPAAIAAFAVQHLLPGFDVTQSSDLEVLNTDSLSQFDVLLPIWTFGELSETREAALCEAVQMGLGLVAWHGAASAFHASKRYKLLLGGQFVAHPGGDRVSYEVQLEPDPLTVSLANFPVTSEQYYLLVDPSVSVVAQTRIIGGELPWLSGVKMPVAWKRTWGEGRVFYCSLGHSIEILQQAHVTELLRRGIAWAKRSRTS